MAETDNGNLYDDGQLLRMFRSGGDNYYLGELYGRYIDLVYGVCLKYLKNAHDASDAVMDVFEELIAKAAQFQIDNFRGWLYVVAKNHCLQKLRRGNREIPVDASDRIMENASFVHLLSERTDEAVLKMLDDCIEKLPEKQSECIIKFFYEHKSYADIVAETLYPLQSVKSFLQNGRRNLKICMEGKNGKL